MAYNVTCNASAQVINEGNPCRAVALVRESSFSPVEIAHDGKTSKVFGASFTVTDPGAYWSPAAMAMPRGRYDEYGGLHLDDEDGFVVTNDDWAVRFEMLRNIVNSMADVLPGQNPVHDVGFDSKQFFAKSAPDLIGFDPLCHEVTDSVKEQISALWEAIWELASEDRLFIRRNNGQYSPVKFALMHEAAYQGLVDLADVTLSYGADPLDREQFVQVLLDKLATGLAEAQAEEDPRKKFHLELRPGEMLRDHFRRIGDRYNYRCSEAVSKALDVYNKTGDQEMIRKALRITTEAAYAVAGMNRMHLSFSPLRYAGDDFENEAGKLFESFVSQTRSKVDRAQYERMWGPYKPYTLTVASSDDADTLIATLCDEWDSHAQIVDLSAMDGGALLMRFEATMSADHFARFEQYVNDDFYGLKGTRPRPS